MYSKKYPVEMSIVTATARQLLLERRDLAKMFVVNTTFFGFLKALILFVKLLEIRVGKDKLKNVNIFLKRDLIFQSALNLALPKTFKHSQIFSLLFLSLFFPTKYIPTGLVVFTLTLTSLFCYFNESVWCALGLSTTALTLLLLYPYGFLGGDRET